MFTENPEDFIYNSSIGVHAVSPEGIILYANECELEVLGYTKEEYVGHHVSEYQIDSNCLSDMMERLSRFDVLKNYPARVQGKVDIKYIIYNSSVYELMVNLSIRDVTQQKWKKIFMMYLLNILNFNILNLINSSEYMFTFTKKPYQ